MSSPAELSDTALRHLTRQVVATGADEPFGAYMFRHDEPGAELGRHLERVVFMEAFGNTPDLLEEEYRPYEKSSAFIVVVDQLRMVPAGAIRVVVPSPAGFKSLNDIEPVWGVPAHELIHRTGMSLDPHKTWDVATLAVESQYRGTMARGLVTMGLYQSLTMSARACGIDWLVAILDMPVFRLLRWKLHMVMVGYKGIGPLPYLGSAVSIPAWCDLVEAEKRYLETDLDLHGVVFEGVGLEPALRRLELPGAERQAAWGSDVAAG